MILKMNMDGSIEVIKGSRVFKRSNAVQEISLFAPFNSQSTILANFELPDGSIYTDNMVYSGYKVDEQLNLWSMPVRQSITENEGRVSLSFEIRTIADNQEITTTAETFINVEKSNSNVVIDEVDQFFELANEGVVRSQQAIDTNNVQDGRLLELETDTENHADRISDLETDNEANKNTISEHGTDLTNHDNRISENESDILTLQSTITSHGNTLTNHSGRIGTLESDNVTNKSNISNLMSSIKTVTDNGDESYTFTTHNNQTFTINRPSEKYTVSGDLDEETQTIIMTFNDGSKINIQVDEIYTHIQTKIQELANQDTVHQGLLDDLNAFKNNVAPKINTLEESTTNHLNRLETLENDNVEIKTDIENIEQRLDSTFTLEEKAKLQAIPTPTNILTTHAATMDDLYEVINEKDLVTKDYLVRQIEGVTGVDLSLFAKDEDLTQLENHILDKITEPSIQEFDFTEPITHVEAAILDSPNEIEEIQGYSEPILTQEEQERASWAVNDELYNEAYIDENGQKRINENVGQKTNVVNENYTNNSGAILRKLYINIPNIVLKSPIIVDGVTYDYSTSDLNPNTYRDSNDVLTVRYPLDSVNIPSTSTVTYELAVKNPKTKVIEDGDLKTYNDTTYSTLYFNKPIDDINYNISEIQNINVGGVIYTTIKNPTTYHVRIPDGVTFNDFKINFVGKTLTYELATPRLAETVGMAHVENPTVKSESPDGEIQELQFNETIRSTPTKSAYDELKLVDGVWTVFENVEEINGEMVVKSTPTQRIANVVKVDDLVFKQGNTIYLESDSGLLPTVKTKCAMDVAAQVKMIMDTLPKTKEDIREINNALGQFDEVDNRLDVLESFKTNTNNILKIGHYVEIDVERGQVFKVGEYENGNITYLEISNRHGSEPQAKIFDNNIFHEGHLPQIEEVENLLDELTIMNTKLQALQGAYIFRGNINYSTNEINANPSLLSSYLDNQQELGDVLIDINQCEWYYNGTTWNNYGQALIGTATEYNEGLVKLGYQKNGNNYPVLMNINTKQVYVNLDSIQAALTTVTEQVNALVSEFAIHKASNNADYHILNNDIEAVSTIVDKLPKFANDISASIMGSSNLSRNNTASYTLVITPETPINNISWTIEEPGDIQSQNGDTCVVSASSTTGQAVLRATVTDFWGNGTKTFTKNINIY